MKNFKNLPKKFKNLIDNKETYRNRGLDFESLIIKTCEYYDKEDKCLILKRPTPIKILKIDNDKKIIKEAFFERKSTTDFNGLINGKYIDIEAKVTKNPKYFPIKNIRKEQFHHLQKVEKYGGLAYFLIKFEVFNEYFLIEANKLIFYIKQNKKSFIPRTFLKEFAYELKVNANLILDFLPFIKATN